MDYKKSGVGVVEKPRRTLGSILKTWFFLCPVRHVLLLLGLVALALYFLLRGNRELMNALTENVIHPYHNLMASFLSFTRVSFAEVFYIAVVLGSIAYLLYCAYRLIVSDRRWAIAKRAYIFVMTFVVGALLYYTAECVCWGVYYYADTFQDKSGIVTQELSTQELDTVTRWFASLANEYGAQVSRDENGIFNEDLDEIFDYAQYLYVEAEKEFECLVGQELRPKEFYFSEILSELNFTGFFFPMTGEANLNVHSPACMIPSTIAHELAHQRGVAPEQEANFVAVLACLSDGNPVFCYSASLLAYIHLGNALYKTDSDLWREVYYSLSDDVRADLSFKSSYWNDYQTSIAEVSDAVYEGFLESHGQTLGLKSYGACVDLLVAYYYEAASAAGY